MPLRDELLSAAESAQPASVATLAALHLVTVLKLHEGDLIASMMTYDHQLTAGAAAHGLTVLAP